MQVREREKQRGREGQTGPERDRVCSNETDGQTDRQTDIQTNREADRHTDRHPDREIESNRK
jgi:hypothetical protein